MATSFSPTRQDVERYRSLRAVSMELNHRILKTIPRQALDEIGDASASGATAPWYSTART